DAAGGVGDDLMFVFELDPERGVRKQLRHDTGKFQEFFLCHPLPSVVGNRTGGSPRPRARKLAESRPSDNYRVRICSFVAPMARREAFPDSSQQLIAHI